MSWDQESLSLSGTSSRLPEGYSRLYRGAIGTIDTSPFQVLGRVRYAFSRGFWDEWYIIFGEDEGCWITENDYQFSIQKQIHDSNLHPKESYRLGQNITIASRDFQITEIGYARCMGIEGELPKNVLPQASYHYLDAISFEGKHTLGIEFHNPPQIYLGTWLEGKNITLEDETLEW